MLNSFLLKHVFLCSRTVSSCALWRRAGCSGLAPSLPALLHDGPSSLLSPLLSCHAFFQHVDRYWMLGEAEAETRVKFCYSVRWNIFRLNSFRFSACAKSLKTMTYWNCFSQSNLCCQTVSVATLRRQPCLVVRAFELRCDPCSLWYHFSFIVFYTCYFPLFVVTAFLPGSFVIHSW